jgi:hypothetical protein
VADGAGHQLAAIRPASSTRLTGPPRATASTANAPARPGALRVELVGPLPPDTNWQAGDDAFDLTRPALV